MYFGLTILSKMKPDKILRGAIRESSKFSYLIFLLSIIVIPLFSQAGVLKGKVTTIQGNIIELDAGSAGGVSVGDVGRVYYTVTVGREEKPVFIAKFKVIQLTPKSIMARIEEKTGEVKVGFLAEIKVEERSITAPSSAVSTHAPKTIDRPVKKEENVKGIEEKPMKYKGLISIMSYPKGIVFINGKKIGHTPLQNMEIPVGRSEILVRVNGDEQKKIVIVRENEPVELFFQFLKSRQ